MNLKQDTIKTVSEHDADYKKIWMLKFRTFVSHVSFSDAFYLNSTNLRQKFWKLCWEKA